MILYFILGVAWSAFLEYYTTKNFKGAIGAPMTTKERLFHITLWPISLGYFIYTFINYRDYD